VDDLTDYDCTSLMIHLKLRLKRMESGDTCVFKLFPEQVCTALDLFSDYHYGVESEKTGDGKICLKITIPS
jgi:hypothetical protein